MRREAGTAERNTAPQARCGRFSSRLNLSLSRVSPSSATSLPAGASRVDSRLSRDFFQAQPAHPHSGDARGIENKVSTQILCNISAFLQGKPSFGVARRWHNHTYAVVYIRQGKLQASEHSPTTRSAIHTRNPGTPTRTRTRPVGRSLEPRKCANFTATHTQACAATDCIAAQGRASAHTGAL
jgi:hypothetical protein